MSSKDSKERPPVPAARGNDSMVSEYTEVELVLGRFAGLESLKFGHQNGKETVVWVR